MTEPQVPVPDWDSLPVLTEVVDTPVPEAALPPQAEVPVLVDFDIPDFDFSAEMAQLADALPDTELSFPPDLTLDEVLSAGEQSPDTVVDGDGALDAEALIGRLPSLDLDVPLPDDLDLGEVLPGFAMPEVAADVPPVAVDDAPWPTDMAAAALAEIEPEAVPSLEERPLEAETLAAASLPAEGVPPQVVVMPGDDGMADAGVPEPGLADVDDAPLLDTVETELTAAAAAAGLAAWLDQAAQVAPPDAAPQVDVPPEVTTAPWEVPLPAAELAATEVDLGSEAAESVPELTAESEAPPVLGEVSPGLVTGAAEADTAVVEVLLSAPEETVATVAADVTASNEVTASVVEWPLAEAEADAVPSAGDATAEVAAVTVEPPLLSDEAAAPLAAGVMEPASGEVAAADEDAAAGDEFAFDLATAEGEAPAGVAAAYVAALDAAPVAAESDAAAHGYPLGESISLDSLPTGVLGGGLGLAASLVAELDAGNAGDMIPDREVELAWARDLGAEPPFDLTPQDATLPVHQVLTAPSPAAAVPEESGLAATAMQLSGVKEVSQPPAVVETAAAEEAPPLDSEALIDALYARVLPRMKVELTLWMQDALEMQARQLMSGVMQHLKEDFDMMLAEALRESLREAIREAKAGQGEQ
ncbi:hypothetical protein [Vogesella alkaliphila]|uniref:Uncharacterized protein n=1 Tax=Vogesella alkaliphila TaxID=1193621 RepID=A0ABQ2YFG2_9NEIS|nr:hypothetical protein [Vogesella alkaliphila]GGX80554.1 hypothetical protein GCM10011290_05310 [Vogesella alkaliphila]